MIICDSHYWIDDHPPISPLAPRHPRVLSFWYKKSAACLETPVTSGDQPCQWG